MGFQLNRRRSRKTADATVYFTHAVSPEGKDQLCVRVKCHSSDVLVGPVWGHSEESVKRALAMLTQMCPCPSSYHRGKEFMGQRVVGGKRSRQ